MALLNNSSSLTVSTYSRRTKSTTATKVLSVSGEMAFNDTCATSAGISVFITSDSSFSALSSATASIESSTWSADSSISAISDKSSALLASSSLFKDTSSSLSPINCKLAVGFLPVLLIFWLSLVAACAGILTTPSPTTLLIRAGFNSWEPIDLTLKDFILKDLEPINLEVVDLESRGNGMMIFLKLLDSNKDKGRIGRIINYSKKGFGYYFYNF